MNDKINKRILITNAGSAIGQCVIDYSRENFSWLGGTDMNQFCYAAKVLGDNFFQSPGYNNWAAYKEFLLGICRKKKIDLLIPCAIDQELLWLARDRKELEALGTKILASDYESIKICNDKYRCFEFVSGLGVKTPKIYLPQKIGKKTSFPFFFKKRESEGSALTQKIESQSDLKYFSTKYKDSVLQELVSGEEFSIDMVLNNSSEMEFACCRKRVETKAGVCTKTEFVAREDLIKIAAFVAGKLKLIGGINVQFIEDYFIEINPRFPGGMGLDCRAGFNMPLMSVKAFFDRSIEKNEKKLKAKKILRIWKEILYE